MVYEEPPEAPVHYSSPEAFAWQSGWASRWAKGASEAQIDEALRHHWHEPYRACICGESVTNIREHVRHVLRVVMEES